MSFNTNVRQATRPTGFSFVPDTHNMFLYTGTSDIDNGDREANFGVVENSGINELKDFTMKLVSPLVIQKRMDVYLDGMTAAYLKNPNSNFEIESDFFDSNTIKLGTNDTVYTRTNTTGPTWVAADFSLSKELTLDTSYTGPATTSVTFLLSDNAGDGWVFGSVTGHLFIIDKGVTGGSAAPVYFGAGSEAAELAAYPAADRGSKIGLRGDRSGLTAIPASEKPSSSVGTLPAASEDILGITLTSGSDDTFKAVLNNSHSYKFVVKADRYPLEINPGVTITGVQAGVNTVVTIQGGSSDSQFTLVGGFDEAQEEAYYETYTVGRSSPFIKLSGTVPTYLNNVSVKYVTSGTPPPGLVNNQTYYIRDYDSSAKTLNLCNQCEPLPITDTSKKGKHGPQSTAITILGTLNGSLFLTIPETTNGAANYEFASTGTSCGTDYSYLGYTSITDRIELMLRAQGEESIINLIMPGQPSASSVQPNQTAIDIFGDTNSPGTPGKLFDRNISNDLLYLNVHYGGNVNTDAVYRNLNTKLADTPTIPSGKAGSGYVVGDLLIVNQGTAVSGRDAIVKVASVDGSGAITGFSASTANQILTVIYRSGPTTPSSGAAGAKTITLTDGHSGDNATLSYTLDGDGKFTADSILITNLGTGYSVDDVFTQTGGASLDVQFKVTSVVTSENIKGTYTDAPNHKTILNGESTLAYAAAQFSPQGGSGASIGNFVVHTPSSASTSPAYIITIENHGYTTNEVIFYISLPTDIQHGSNNPNSQGLTGSQVYSGSIYYITKLSDHTFTFTYNGVGHPYTAQAVGGHIDNAFYKPQRRIGDYTGNGDYITIKRWGSGGRTGGGPLYTPLGAGGLEKVNGDSVQIGERTLNGNFPNDGSDPPRCELKISENYFISGLSGNHFRLSRNFIYDFRINKFSIQFISAQYFRTKGITESDKKLALYFGMKKTIFGGGFYFLDNRPDIFFSHIDGNNRITITNIIKLIVEPTIIIMQNATNGSTTFVVYNHGLSENMIVSNGSVLYQVKNIAPHSFRLQDSSNAYLANTSQALYTLGLRSQNYTNDSTNTDSTVGSIVEYNNNNNTTHSPLSETTPYEIFTIHSISAGSAELTLTTNGSSELSINQKTTDIQHFLRAAPEPRHGPVVSYIESAIPTDSNEQFFILDIAEFNIKNNSNNPKLLNKVIIPNSNTSGKAASTDNVSVHTFKGKKYNYISTIEPKTISELNITLTTADGTSSALAFPGQQNPGGATNKKITNVYSRFASLFFHFVFIDEDSGDDLMFINEAVTANDIF